MLVNRRGFTLVELLVVVAIFGVVSTVVLDLYVNVVRTTTSSEEVVEIQQGMRIALDRMANDIQMAGFLVQSDEAAFPNASVLPVAIVEARNNRITMETATAFSAFARISNTETIETTETEKSFTVSNAAMADLFRKDNYVRIISPIDGCQLTVSDCGARDGTAPLFQISEEPGATSLTLERTSGAAEILVPAGSMIVRVPSPADNPPMTYPNTITYSLEPDPVGANSILSRNWGAGLSINDRTLATNITGLRFEYLMDDGTVAPSPTAAAGTAVAVARLDNIVAVRIFLTGQTENATVGQNKTRELQTTVKIRNI